MSNSNPKKTRRPPAVNPDRLPPHSMEAEEAVLGTLLADPERAVDMLNECQESGVKADWFYDLRHQTIWQAIAAMHTANEKVDLVTVVQHLRDRGMEEGAGGSGYLLQLREGGAAVLRQYLDILHEKYLLRAVVKTGVEMVAGAFSIEEGEKTDAATLVARAEREILRLGEEGAEGSEQRIKDIILAVTFDLEDYHRGQAQVRGLTTGLEYVDKLLCGMGGEENGNYIVLSGRPSTGKTALALQIADHVSIEHVWWEPVLADNGHGKLEPVKEPGPDGMERFKVERKVGLPVGIFSLEMTKKGLGRRLLFRRAQADVQRWRTGFATANDFQALTVAAGQLAVPNRIVVEDQGVYVWESLKAKARRWVRQYGTKLFIVDYMQLMESGERRFREDRVRELGEISKGIQRLGKELNVPFIIIAQMNRDYDKEKTRKPRLSDLKDCGQIEQDADVVGFLYEATMKEAAEEKYESAMNSVYGQDWSKYPKRVNLLIAKARNGPTDDCQLLFQKSCQHFMDYTVWLKEHGQMGAAKGEGHRYTREAPSTEGLEKFKHQTPNTNGEQGNVDDLFDGHSD